ncbi:MAG: Rieske (2Fe-2S) protein [Bradymonadia bacterium]
MSTHWTRTFTEDELPRGSRKVFKHAHHQIAVFHLDDGEIFAVDNRCPHEGYPLAQGVLDGCTLTCSWHNFKFDLRDGACLKGEEAVKSWPVRRREGVIEVDLTEPDPATLRPAIFESLAGALYERRPGQLARDVVRLLQTGDDHEMSAEILAYAAAEDCQRGQYGNDHGLPVAADTFRVIELLIADGRVDPLEARVVALTQALEMNALFLVRRPRRPMYPALAVDEGWGEALLESVEKEDLPRAEGLLRGMLDTGASVEEVMPWLIRVNAAHLLSFGHGLIYVVKAFELLESVGWPLASEILPGVLTSLVNGTREDTLPAWRSFNARMAERLEAVLPHVEGLEGEGDPIARGQLAERLLEAPTSGAVDVILDAVVDGASLVTCAEAVALAASRRLARFDPEIDRRLDVQDTWLFATHLLTHAEALLVALPHVGDRRAALRLVCLAARFVVGGRASDAPEWQPPTPAGDAELLWASLKGGDREGVLASAEALMANGQIDVIEQQIIHHTIMGDHVARAIFLAHHVKTPIAACRLARRLKSPWPIRGVMHWLTSASRERVVVQQAKEAIALVTEGRTPKMLWK